MRASSTASLYLPEPRLHGTEIFGERTHGAYTKTVPAGYTLFRVGNHHLGFDAVVNQIKHTPAGNLPARMDTTEAEHAPVLKITDQRRGKKELFLRFTARADVNFFKLMLEHEILELTLTARIADGALFGMMDQQKLEVILSHPKQLFRVRRDGEAFNGGSDA
jgi:hypothetical protein